MWPIDPTKTKPAIANNALVAPFLAPKVPMQVGEILQQDNLAPAESDLQVSITNKSLQV